MLNVIYLCNVPLRYFCERFSVFEDDVSPPPVIYCSWVNHRDDAIRYGGRTVLTRETCSEVWAFNVRSKLWRKLRCGGTPPEARFGHSAVLFEGRMWVFGGVDYDSMLLSDFRERGRDLFCLDFRIEPPQWSRVAATGAGPEARHAHSAVVCKACMYIFGGEIRNGRTSDLHRFDLTSLQWSKVYTIGPQPIGRSHAAVWANSDEERIYVYGGEIYPADGQNRFGSMSFNDANVGVRTTNDFFAVGLADGEWHSLRVLGDNPRKIQVQSNGLKQA
jgi:hypothetical protein